MANIFTRFLSALRWAADRILLVMVALMAAGCQPMVERTPTPVTIALPALEQNVLIYIAQDQGFFEKQGLKVSMQDHDSGITALDALLRGDAALAVAAEFPITRALMDGGQMMVVASIDKFENDYLVAREDRGITRVEDLKGKSIGLTRGTINEFFLGRFLELNGLASSDVTLVDLKPARFVEAFSAGEVDALVAWQPYIQQAQEAAARRSVRTVTWPAQSSQAAYGVLVVSKSWLEKNPQPAIGFLKALAQAEDFLARSPEKSQEIVQKRLNYTPEYVSSVWGSHEYGLTLDNSLVVAMNDEARWMAQNGLAPEGYAGNIIDSIYPDALAGLKPEAVNLHR